MYTALYRTQRPEVFSEIIGQDHIVRILRNQINTGTVSHAYLFCGTRGTGKTTTARILAKAVNCLEPEGDEVPCGHCANCMAIKEGNFMDVIEIDAASNNGVDNIRELRESVKYPPAVGRKKVYIIDEVHMLSTGASNALLKTLEEPPENVMFVLATTDPQKLPQTILSRCMRLDFKRVSEKTLITHMGAICREKGIDITDSALRLLAANADGSVRDGLSILDQCLAGGDKKLDRDDILEFLGTVSEEFFIELTERVALHDVAGALLAVERALSDGKDVKQLMKDWMSHYRGLLVTKYIKNAEDMLNMSSENIEKLRQQSAQISLDEINDAILTLSKTINDARYSTQPRVLLELAIVIIAEGLTTSGGLAPSGAGKGNPSGIKTNRVPAAGQALEGTGAFDGARTGAGAAGFDRGGAGQVSAQTTGGLQTSGAESQGAEASAEPAYDLDHIWARVFEMGEDIKGSFNLIRSGASLAGIRGDEFKVVCSSEFMKNYVEDNRQSICQLMEQIVGKHMKMICVGPGRSEATSKDVGYSDLAKEVEEKLNLGIKVRVE